MVQVGLESVVLNQGGSQAPHVSVVELGYPVACAADEVVVPHLLDPLVTGLAASHPRLGDQAHLPENRKRAVDRRHVHVGVRLPDLLKDIGG